MNVLVIGGGSREHAIAWKLLLAREVRNVFVAPGNGGSGMIARNLAVNTEDIMALAGEISRNQIDLVIVGPEAPLAAGIVDNLSSLRVAVFGPTAAAAQLESSKWFAKDLMMANGVPCASGEVFEGAAQALSFILKHEPPFVVKADGLAAGKGVVIAPTRELAASAVTAMMNDRIFGAAGSRVVIEQYLEGREYSFFAFTDGEVVVPMVPARDYKRILDNDEGPNTGGMGSYSAPAFVTPDVADFTTHQVIEPVVKAMGRAGTPYRGILYAGMMLTPDGPKVIEFNCRMGDPEAQVVFPRLETDLHTIALACAEGRLQPSMVSWSPRATVGVVMASRGYPEGSESGQAITGLDRMDEGVRVFHGATRVPPSPAWNRTSWIGGRDAERAGIDELLSGRVETAGGRVLTVVASGRTVAEARALAYANVERIKFEGAQYRRDIAAEAVE